MIEPKKFVLGCDEVGYGSIAGPVVVCGVHTPVEWDLEGLNDSKKLTPKKREKMRDRLHEFDPNVTFHIAERSNANIDEYGITECLKSCFVEVFHKLYTDETLIIIDGTLEFDNMGVDGYDKISVVKADAKFPAVMAASILAKTYRDGLMLQYHKIYDMYGWNTNMGYGSKKHIDAIKEFGFCKLHRKSYKIKGIS